MATDSLQDLRRKFYGGIADGSVVLSSDASVKAYGAKGDGTTLDTAAINSAITANGGKTVWFPVGTYLIDATTGIKLNQAGTRLRLEQGATIQVQTNSADAYMAIEVTAADCVIEGGTIRGDVDTHTGTTGEWGHLIVAQGGAHRLRVENVTLTKAWGDGIAVQGGPSDVNIVNITADDNRRQGCSVIQSTRTRILGGVYKNTGLTKSTAPTAGIDVEPNASGSVVDCHITDVVAYGNKGPNIQVAAAATSSVTVTISACRAVGSTTSMGYYIVGPVGTIKAVLSDCYSGANALHGFSLNADSVEMKACTSRENTQYGVQVNASFCTITGTDVLYNGRVGVQISGVAVDSTAIIGGLILANSQSANGTYFNFDNFGINTRLVGVVSDAGTGVNKPAAGFAFRASSTARAIGCSARNTFTSQTVSDSSAGGTVMNPNPQAVSPFSVLGASTTTVAPAAGGAGALPATPLGYITLNVDGTDRKVAYY